MPLIQEMKWIRTICMTLAIGLGCAKAQRVGIGEWDSYFTYTVMYDVAEADGKVIWISELSALYYDLEDKSVQVFNKIQGLSQTGLSRIAYNPQTKTTVIGYNDGNLDLLSFDENNKSHVVNMSDIKRSSLTGDKKVYALYSYNQYMYVSCGFGIVVIDLERQEVKDTYIIGPGSSQIKINGVTIGNDTIYAATETGMYKAYQHHPFLNNFSSWSKYTSIPAWLANMPFKQPCFVNNTLFLLPDYATFGQDTCYYKPAGTWTKLPILQGQDMINIQPRSGGQMVFVTTANITVTNSALVKLADLFSYNGPSLFVNNAVYAADNFFYTADAFKGPFRCPNSFMAESLLPGGTKSSAVRRVVSDGKQLWVAAGQVSGTIFASTYNIDYFSVRENNEWTYINRDTDPILNNNAYDAMDVAIDPTDETHVMASAWSMQGLIEMKNKVVTGLYDETNSILFSPIGNPGFCGVASLEFDEDGNLWCLNGQSNYPLVVKTKDGSWKSFYCGPEAAGRTYYDIVMDANGYKYIPYPTTGTNAGGVTVYNDKGTPLDETDDEFYAYRSLAGYGNLPDGDVKCVAIDLDGQVWIGTGKGPTVIYNPTNIFSGSNSDAQQILIQQDGNTQILLETETVTCIEVDGANRKWMGTENSGVYLLSEDGQEQIYHFTVDNSPLPSNTIYDIEIDGKSGEVYFATANGLLSYRGTATNSHVNFDDIKVFPNPVRPDYEGVIAVNGLSRDSDVKVTDIAGNIVNVVKSEGGQAIWDGKNLKGERVKSGVYLFMCSSEDGANKVAAKVMFIE